MRQNFKFTDKYGKEINAYKWTGDKKPKAIVYIVHGMVENAKRYDYLANKLVNEGYIVYSHDHRGHGDTDKTQDKRGYIADSEGFDILVENVEQLIENAKDENKGLELILFGHSMGSFVSLRYMQLNGKGIDRVILSGTDGKVKPISSIGIIIARLEIALCGRMHKSKLMDKLIFGGFNNKFKPARTEFDWICANKETVDEYIENPDYGFVCSASFYYDLMRGLKKLHRKEEMNKLKKNISFYIFAGDMDPVGQFGEGVKSLVKELNSYGLKNVKYKLYEGGRHEMLNEENRDEVIDDMIKYLSMI